MRFRSYTVWMIVLALGLGLGAAATWAADENSPDKPVPRTGSEAAPDSGGQTGDGDQNGGKTDPPPKEAEGGEKDPEEEKPGKPDSVWPFGGGMTPLLLLGGAFILMFWFSGRSRRKTEAKRREMLSALGKGDKITSIGGIVGTVIEVREDEITVKVDETNNIRMKFARWAIRGVGDEGKVEKPEDKR